MQKRQDGDLKAYHNAPNATYILCSYPMKWVTYTLYSTWCIVICLMIPIVSLLLFIQSLHSLSKLLVMYCLDSVFQEVKGLAGKCYAYPEEKMRSSTAMVIELGFFMKNL